MSRPLRILQYRPVQLTSNLQGVLANVFGQMAPGYLVFRQVAGAVPVTQLRTLARSRRAAHKHQSYLLLTFGDVTFVTWYNTKSAAWFYEWRGVTPL